MSDPLGASFATERSFGTDTVLPFGADRSETLKVRRRFMNLNRLRLKHLYESLPQTQRVFVELLPLLYHTNHPLLPGYVDKECPCGVSDYTPSAAVLARATRIARSFSPRTVALRKVDIQAIYLMGSSGTIAQSSSSDLDVWLCHPAGLPPEGVNRLRAKSQAITAWARSLGLEVHIFLMSAEQFRAGGAEALSSESSGTAQHYLLLDEFYRTGLLLAGRAPLWWVVPPEVEGEYPQFVSTLIEHRFIKPEDYLDFGTVAEVRPAEFFGAALWQLSKAISAPHKSLLKILLLEAYASDWPKLDLLSLRFKRAIYGGERNIERLDPYVLLYHKVEEYLQARGDEERLELARRCLYFKANRSLIDLRRRDDWPSEVMMDLTCRWDWDEKRLRVLDARRAWKVDRTLEERQALVNALTHSYRFLSLFAREHAGEVMVSEHDMTILGRKLFAAFEHKAGKIEIVNYGISQDLSESHLLIQQLTSDDERSQWVLYRGTAGLTGGRRQPLKRGRSLLELVVWCHFNGLLTAATRLAVDSAERAVTSRDVEVLRTHLQRHFSAELAGTASIEALAENPCLVAAGTFINFGAEPLPEHARRGNVLTTNRSDALSYSAWHENLVQAVDYLVATSWGEVLVFRYQGIEGLLRCLCEHLGWIARSKGCAAKVSHCSAPRYAAAVSRRVADLFDGVGKWFFSAGDAPRRRYIIKGGTRYYSLMASEGTLRHEWSGAHPELLQHLGRPNPAFTLTTFDDQALEEELLGVIFEENRQDRVQFFYDIRSGTGVIFCLDENGALFRDKVPCYSEKGLIGQFARFFESVRFRQNSAVEAEGAQPYAPPPRPPEIEFFRIERTEAGRFRLRPVEYARAREAREFFNVQVIGEVVDGEIEFTLFCNNVEFSTRELGEQLFERVVDYILARRRHAQRYPIYITDIDLSWLARRGRSLQTIHYLHYKRRIEHRLNRALASRPQD